MKLQERTARTHSKLVLPLFPGSRKICPFRKTALNVTKLHHSDPELSNRHRKAWPRSVPSSTSTQRIVRAHGLRYSTRANSVPAWESGARGQPGSGLTVGKPRRGTAAQPVEPLAGEAGEQTGTVQEPSAAVCRGDGRPQVRFSEGRESVSHLLSVRTEINTSLLKNPRK